ncbi:MAG: Fic family protein [Euzebya sp.]
MPIKGRDRRYDEEYEHVAYVPDILPDKVDLAPETWTALMRAQAAIGRLDGAVSELPDPLLLVRPLVRSEAVSTSALEGTHTGFGDLLGAEEQAAPTNSQVMEVLNYVHAAEEGIAALADLPVCMRLINAAHGTLLRGVRGDGYAVGRIRKTQNWIGPTDCRVYDAALVPPPHHLLPELLSHWEEWVHRADLPLLVRVALGHYQFETLHPYVDGNGRLGRLVVILQLIEENLVHHHVMTISGFFERDKANYIGQLQLVRETGEFDPWVRYFSDGLHRSAEQSLALIRTAQRTVRELVTDLRDTGARGLAIQIAEDLIGFPVVTARAVESRYDVSYNTANAAIRRLETAGMLIQVSAGNYNRTFAAPRVLAIFG